MHRGHLGKHKPGQNADWMQVKSIVLLQGEGKYVGHMHRNTASKHSFQLCSCEASAKWLILNVEFLYICVYYILNKLAAKMKYLEKNENLKNSLFSKDC